MTASTPSPEAVRVYQELWLGFQARAQSERGREQLRSTQEAVADLDPPRGLSEAEAAALRRSYAWTSVAVGFALEAVAEYLARHYPPTASTASTSSASASPPA